MVELFSHDKALPTNSCRTTTCCVSRHVLSQRIATASEFVGKAVTTTNEAMMIEQFLKPWKVTGTEALPNDAAVVITIRTPGRDPIKFRSESMGPKGRGKRATLARFASACGMGTAEDLFKFSS